MGGQQTLPLQSSSRMVIPRPFLVGFILVGILTSLPAQTLLTRTAIPLGQTFTQAGKLEEGERTYTPFLFAFDPDGDILLADVYKSRVAVYSLEGKFKTFWEPGSDYGPWITFFYAGSQRVLWGDARVVTSGPRGEGQPTSLNQGGLFPLYRGFSGGKLSIGVLSGPRKESLILSEDLGTVRQVYQSGNPGSEQTVAWGWGGEYHPISREGVGTFLGNEPGVAAYYTRNEGGSTVITQVDRQGKTVKTYQLYRDGSLPESGLWTVYQPGKVVAQLFAWEDRVEVVRWRLE